MALAAGLLLAACSDPVCPRTDPGDPKLDIDPIQITSVDVRILESSPPQAAARIQGVIGDACSDLHSVSQRRSGKAITITILRRRPREAICAQIARLYDEDLPLEGQYPPGEYVLRVNDFQKTFTTQ